MKVDYRPENISQELYEKRKMKEFNSIDKDCPNFTRYMRNNLAGIIFFSFIVAIALVYLGAEFIDNAPEVAIGTIGIAAFVIGVIIIKSAKNSRNGK